MPVTFIAEASSNHAQDLSRALAFVDAAADCGCDAVKFQLFRLNELFAPEILARSAKHRARSAWELPVAHLAPLAAHARDRGIQFSCTPFYLDAVKELEPYVAFYKIASYELLWGDLLEACARTGKPVIVSTGMATMPEILSAVATLKRAGCCDVTALHCVSAYPAPPEEANLSAIAAIRRRGSCSRRLVRSHAQPRGDRARGPSLGREHGGIPSRSRRHGRRIRGRPLLAARRDRAGDRAHPRRDARRRRRLQGPAAAELSDREWRADPIDGLRPLRHIRADWKPAA